jgi:hypothetical protein
VSNDEDDDDFEACRGLSQRAVNGDFDYYN